MVIASTRIGPTVRVIGSIVVQVRIVISDVPGVVRGQGAVTGAGIISGMIIGVIAGIAITVCLGVDWMREGKKCRHANAHGK
jgi:hypothetical protein